MWEIQTPTDTTTFYKLPLSPTAALCSLQQAGYGQNQMTVLQPLIKTVPHGNHEQLVDQIMVYQGQQVNLPQYADVIQVSIFYLQ